MTNDVARFREQARENLRAAGVDEDKITAALDPGRGEPTGREISDAAANGTLGQLMNPDDDPGAIVKNIPRPRW